MKRCSKCKIYKEEELFSKNSKSPSGKRSCCKQCQAIAKRAWYLRNAEKERQRRFRDYWNNREILLERQRKSRNSETGRAKSRQRTNLRLQNRENRLAHNLRHRINKALKGNFKIGSAVRELGCSIAEFKIYLESLFQPGMTWENYGIHGWHLDHVKPLSHFDLLDEVQFKKACHFTNLQPLWAWQNWSKGKKLTNTSKSSKN